MIVRRLLAEDYVRSPKKRRTTGYISPEHELTRQPVEAPGEPAMSPTRSP